MKNILKNIIQNIINSINMDLLELFTTTENSPTNNIKTTKRRRSFCDILPELPVFENTKNRLQRAKRQQKLLYLYWQYSVIITINILCKINK